MPYVPPANSCARLACAQFERSHVCGTKLACLSLVEEEPSLMRTRGEKKKSVLPASVRLDVSYLSFVSVVSGAGFLPGCSRAHQEI